MKKFIRNDRMILIIPAIIVIFIFGGLFFLLNTTSKVRMYKRTLCSLATSPYEVTAEYDGVTVELAPDNKKKLMNLFGSAKYHNRGTKKPSGDVIHFEVKESTDWTIDIYEVDKDNLLIEVQGGDHFLCAVENNGKFKRYLRLGSPDGWEEANTVIE